MWPYIERDLEIEKVHAVSFGGRQRQMIYTKLLLFIRKMSEHKWGDVNDREKSVDNSVWVDDLNSSIEKQSIALNPNGNHLIPAVSFTLFCAEGVLYKTEQSTSVFNNNCQCKMALCLRVVREDRSKLYC